MIKAGYAAKPQVLEEGTPSTNNCKNNRILNYDYLRVFAMLMVIVNHIADYYLVFSHPDSRTIYIYEGISHCAVPLFLMLTGAFVINKAGKTSAKTFYINSAIKLGVPFVFFVVIYYLYDSYHSQMKLDKILNTLLTGFNGTYAHWYVVMLAVIYAFVPLIAFVKNRVPYKKYEKVVIILFFWLIIGKYYENSQVTWSLSNLYLMGYVLMGDVITERIKNRKNNLVGILLIIAGVLMLICNHLILHATVTNAEGDYYNKFLNMYSAPLIVLSSIIIFTGFSILQVKRSVYLLAGTSYTVFLSHKLILNILRTYTPLFEIIEHQFYDYAGIMIPLESLLLLLISFVFSLGFHYVLDKTVYKKYLKKRN